MLAHHKYFGIGTVSVFSTVGAILIFLSTSCVFFTLVWRPIVKWTWHNVMVLNASGNATPIDKRYRIYLTGFYRWILHIGEDGRDKDFLRHQAFVEALNGKS